MIGMGKSLMDYNIERSSSTDIKNIKWTKKNPSDPNKSKKKKKKQISPTNTLSSIDTKTQTNNQKIFKIKDNIRTIKKKKTTSKASKCFIVTL